MTDRYAAGLYADVPSGFFMRHHSARYAIERTLAGQRLDGRPVGNQFFVA